MLRPAKFEEDKKEAPVELSEEDLSEIQCKICGEYIIKYFSAEHEATCKQQVKKLTCPICNCEQPDHASLNDHLVAHEFDKQESPMRRNYSSNMSSGNVEEVMYETLY